MLHIQKLTGSASALTLAVALQTTVFGVATAQTEVSRASESVNVGDVVVTARRSIDTSAVDIKRTAAATVDAVTASDIERTTDTTLPEALERVVGVSADAFYGTSDAGYASIRGFDSRYNSMEIDGNPIWFSSQNNRGAQINMFPAGIVKETSVYKTVSPDQDHNAIGGHIALRTLRAFDGGAKPYLTLGARLGRYDQESRINDGPSGSVYAAGKTTFGSTKQFGLVAGVNYQRYANADVYSGVDSYTQVNGQDQANGNIYTNSHYDKLTRNLSLFGKLEVQATDKLYAFLSANLFDETKNLYLQRANTFVSATGGRTITQTGQGTATFTGGEGQVREYDYDVHRRAKIIGAGVDYALAGDTALVMRANYTDFYNNVLLRNLGDGFRLSGVNGAYDLNGEVATVTPSDPTRYATLANWVFRNTAATSGPAAYNRDQILKDKVYAARADLTHNVQASARGIGATAGVSWTRLDRGFDQNSRFFSLPGAPSLTLADFAPAGSSMADHAAIKTNWNGFWDRLWAGGVSRLDSAPTTDYQLREDVLAGHAALYVSGANFRAIAGLRYEHTRDKTGTANLIRNVVTPVTRKHDYGNWLPNLQGWFEPRPQLRLRAAFTKTLGRPDFADFAPGLTTTFDANGVPTNNGTNPQLGPRVSTNYDAGIEYYLSDGILALAVFRKNVDGETFSQRFEERDAAGQLTAINTIPLNTGAAKLAGVEATFAKRRFERFPAPFNRLGVQANYTYLDGQWDVVLSNGAQRSVSGLRNQPKWLANLQLSYHAGPVDLNLNYRKRGRSFTGTFGATATGDRWIDGYDALDAKVSWKVRRGLSASIEARNLTGSYIRQTTGGYDSLYNTVGAGRSYFAGVRYRY